MKEITLRDILDWFDRRKIPYQRGYGYIEILPNCNYVYYKCRYDLVKKDLIERFGDRLGNELIYHIDIDRWFCGLTMERRIINLVGLKEETTILWGDLFIDREEGEDND